MNRTQKYCCAGVTVFFLIIIIVIVVVTTRHKGIAKCNKSQCPGPLRFYDDLNCKAIYAEPGDCCASEYDCSHIFNRLPDKCYVNGHQYNIGDYLNPVDAEPCDVGCRCVYGKENVATFKCASVDCSLDVPKPGCYLQRDLNACCPISQICPSDPKLITMCFVDGKIYSEGDIFYPEEDPTLTCLCMAGYEGMNVPPFCKKTKCGNELRNGYEINKKCAPVYHSNFLPATSCNWEYRCQTSNDTVIKNGNNQTGVAGQCEFGDLMMAVGDLLNNSNNTNNSNCMQCKCEIPPVPTCRRLNETECKTIYPLIPQLIPNLIPQLVIPPPIMNMTHN